jgi:hypothetical protein
MKEAVYRLAKEDMATKSTFFFASSSVSPSTMLPVLMYHPYNLLPGKPMTFH